MRLTFCMLTILSRMGFVTGNDNLSPILEKISDMSLDIISLELEVLQIERKVLTDLALAREHLKTAVMSELIPQYIQGQVQASMSDIFRSRTVERMVSEHVIEELNSLRGNFHQFRKRFHTWSDQIGDLQEQVTMDTYVLDKHRQCNQETGSLEDQVKNVTTKQGQYNQRVRSLQDDVTANKNKLKNMENGNRELKRQMNNLETQNERLIEKLQILGGNQQVVAYQVRLLRDISFRDDVTIKFDDVIYNRGGGYDKDSGIFTPPVAGTYILWANIMRNYNFWMTLNIKRGEEILVRGYSTAGPHPHDVASITGVFYLNKGDNIRICLIGHGGLIPVRGDLHSSYGGALLQAH